MRGSHEREGRAGLPPILVMRHMFISSARQKGNGGQRITPPMPGKEGVRPIVPSARELNFGSVLRTRLGEVVSRARDRCGSVDEQDDGI